MMGWCMLRNATVRTWNKIIVTTECFESYPKIKKEADELVKQVLLQIGQWQGRHEKRLQR